MKTLAIIGGIILGILPNLAMYMLRWEPEQKDRLSR